MPSGLSGAASGPRDAVWRAWSVLCALLLLAVAAQGATPLRKQTVCTITVNSADEKETFRRWLPASRYDFVELVERGRSDWLTRSCRAGVRCDILVVSGHFDGANEFFSDQLEVREYLPVSELERVSCNGSCPGLFSQLKEVYLFGCNTLNPQPQVDATAEIVRSLVREGHSTKEAERELQAMTALHGESSRDRMRQIFAGVPVIYGFSSTAPLGPLAASALERHFRAGGAREVGSGRTSTRLLAQFSTFSLAAAPGLLPKDPQADARADMCHFADDRKGPADKLAFVHRVLQRHAAESRVYLDRIQRLATALDDRTRAQPAVAQALASIERDDDARERFLGYARNAEQPSLRLRMLDVAQQLGWLDPAERWQELALMLGDLQARKTVGPGEIELACSLNRQHEVEGLFARRVGEGDDVAHAAVRACLGSSEARERVLQALLGTSEADARVAQLYLRQRPLTDADELRRLAAGIERMPASDAQVHALEALAHHYLSDGEIVAGLTRLYSATPSAAVQVAIAGILMRADRKAIASPQLRQALVRDRRRGPPGENMIDALISRLSAP